MALEKGKVIYPGVEDEVALEQAKGTISDLVDALVELITNSDDSYSSAEQDGNQVSGRIDIAIKRAKGGNLVELMIRDEAQGMSPSKVEEIIRYGKRTSEMYRGKSVRGFFGRGLKESIIALGEGEIRTTADGVQTRGMYYYDFDSEKLAWNTVEVGKETKEHSGTMIRIVAREGERVPCQAFDTLSERISAHYALRDILSNPNRKMTLIVETIGHKTPKVEGPNKLVAIAPSGQQIEKRNLYLPKGFGVAYLELYEASSRLDYSRNDPGSQAGILVRTGSATLDNQLFGFDNDPDAHFFFGEVRCPGIAERIRASCRGLVKPDRTGLQWRHEYCRELEAEVKKILQHHIERKRRQAESHLKREEMPKDRAAKFERMFKKLNALARELLTGVGPGPGVDIDTMEIKRLTIYPTEASAPPQQKRMFTIYTPVGSIRAEPRAEISLDDPRGEFALSCKTAKLAQHGKRHDLAIASFGISGFRENDKTGIIVRQGSDEDYAEFQVSVLKTSKKPKSHEPPKERKGGLFKRPVFDTIDRNPLQRVYYNRDTGDVTVYVRYPGIYPHLGENGDGCETERGAMLLSELVAEAFCRETARRKVEGEFFDPETRLDQYLKLYNEHLKRCIPLVHSIWLR